jgi:type II secretory pathway pseudopilin PulG
MQPSQLQIRKHVGPRAENPQSGDSESGYVLLAVIFLTVILLVSLAVAAPKIAMSIQRDKELEAIHRGEQYKRALKLYYQKFGSYPTSIDQLVETNQLRFLRKKYTDPFTGKADWKPILFGQAHVRPLGFFGQPLMTAGGTGGSSMYAVAASTTTDANGVPIASPNQSNTPGGLSGSSGSSFGSSSGFGSSSPSSGFGSSSPSSGFGSSGSSLGSSSSGFGSQNGSSGGFGSSSSPTSGFGSSSGSGGSGTSATTFGGGGPIVGFTLPVDKPSLVLYKQQTRYNKWEFNYDPMEDQAQAMTGLAGGGTPPTGTNPSSTNGLTPGTTSPGTLPTNPTTPPAAPTTDPTAPQ